MQLAKYIVILWQGREHAVAFPETVKHSDVYNHIRHDNPGTRAVSAGFFCEDEDAFWHGGQSETLGLQSRAQDAERIRAMLKSVDRRLWDLRVLVWEACEAQRRRELAIRSPEMSFN